MNECSWLVFVQMSVGAGVNERRPEGCDLHFVVMRHLFALIQHSLLYRAPGVLCNVICKRRNVESGV